MPESEASKAIAKSYFKFLPQYDKKEPICISGKPERQKGCHQFSKQAALRLPLSLSRYVTPIETDLKRRQ